MKKGLVYYFVVVSLLLHLLAILGLRHLPWEIARPDKKDNQPLAIDLIGPARHGKETAIPKYPEKPPEDSHDAVNTRPETEHSKKPLMTARATPQRAVKPSPPPSPARPAAKAQPRQKVETPKTPAPPPTPAKKAGVPEKPADVRREALPVPGPAAGSTPEPSHRVTPEPSGPAAPSPVVPGSGEAPRRLVQPTVEDLMRYAKVDREVKRVEPEKGITLDTEDLMYTSYMQGLKRRIELVWKYPETAQKDGLQGDLVMTFSITRSGKVESIELVRSSGYPILDRAAERALIDASPFNPLPDSWNKERFTITGTFIYRLYGLYLR